MTRLGFVKSALVALAAAATGYSTRRAAHAAGLGSTSGRFAAGGSFTRGTAHVGEFGPEWITISIDGRLLRPGIDYVQYRRPR